MNTGTNPTHSLPPELLTARNLSVVALVLFALFSTVMAGALFPFQWLNSAWQLRLVATLINASAFPLVGLALLHLAPELDPDDPLLWRRRRRFSELAVIVVLGFLLLVPLQGMAIQRESSSLHRAQSSRISGAERTLVALRQAVSTAGSSSDLNQRLQRLQGPVLSPADIAQPLPLLKTQVNAVLDQAQIQINQERLSVPPVQPWTLLPDLLRNSIACLALAIGFAALAVRPGSEISLLQEWQLVWEHTRLRHRHGQLRHRQGRGRQGRRQEELVFLRQNNGKEEG